MAPNSNPSTQRSSSPPVAPLWIRSPHAISAAQCRAARGLVDWSLERLSEHAGVPTLHVFRFERGGRLAASSVAALKRALEDGGAVFLPENAGRGAGVRLKFSRQSVKRIDVWENEGGPVRDDDTR